MLDKGEAEATSRQEVKGRGEQATRRWGPLVSLATPAELDVTP